MKGRKKVKTRKKTRKKKVKSSTKTSLNTRDRPLRNINQSQIVNVINKFESTRRRRKKPKLKKRKQPSSASASLDISRASPIVQRMIALDQMRAFRERGILDRLRIDEGRVKIKDPPKLSQQPIQKITEEKFRGIGLPKKDQIADILMEQNIPVGRKTKSEMVADLANHLSLELKSDLDVKKFAKNLRAHASEREGKGLMKNRGTSLSGQEMKIVLEDEDEKKLTPKPPSQPSGFVPRRREGFTKIPNDFTLSTLILEENERRNKQTETPSSAWGVNLDIPLSPPLNILPPLKKKSFSLKRKKFKKPKNPVRSKVGTPLRIDDIELNLDDNSKVKTKLQFTSPSIENRKARKKALIEIINTNNELLKPGQIGIRVDDSFTIQELDNIRSIQLEDIREDDSDGEVYQQGSGKKVRPLYSDEILKIMKPYFKKGFTGVFAFDEVDSEVNKRAINDFNQIGFIMNLDDAKDEGSHWVAVYISHDRKAVNYYDSFANPPNEVFLRRIKSVLDENPTARKYFYKLKWNKITNQRSNSVTCGLFAMDFLMNMFDGKSFKECTGYTDIQEKRVRRRFGYI